MEKILAAMNLMLSVKYTPEHIIKKTLTGILECDVLINRFEGRSYMTPEQTQIFEHAVAHKQNLIDAIAQFSKENQ